MTGPRDAPASGTGSVTPNQQHHLDAINDAGEGLYLAMHNADGSSPPSEYERDHHFSSRRMAIAATNLETALMYARKAALE